MKTNPEQLPAIFFDWIQHHSFDALNVEQQKEILQYMSADEYTELFDSAQLLAESSRTLNADSRKLLLNRFDQHYAQSKKPLNIQWNTMWKAASILLFISTCMFAYKSSLNIQHETRTVVQHDTIYLDRNIATLPANRLPVHETSIVKPVDLPSAQKPQYRRAGAQKTLVHQSVSNSQKPSIPSYAESKLNDDLHTISIDEINNKPNAHKHNSMKDDSLEKNFRFVSL